MSNSALYNLYTEDYSADTIRNAPVTIRELIREGISEAVAIAFVKLSEQLYSSFLKDALHGSDGSDETVSIWCELLNLCVEHNISACDSTEAFPLYPFDVVLHHHGSMIPREICCFRLTLEQALSCVNLAERKLEHEYNLVFMPEADDTTYMCAVRFHPNTHQLQKVPDSDLRAIASNIQARLKKIEDQTQLKAIEQQIRLVLRDSNKIQEILEAQYLLEDEKVELEALEERLQAILDQPPIHSLSRKDCVWIITGKDACKEDNHHIMDIRANLEFYDNVTRRFTIDRCAHCQRYRIQSKEFERIWRKHGLPKVTPIFLGVDGTVTSSDSDYSNDWSDWSVFSEHGYSVSQEKGLTAEQRQRTLKWIIDHKIRTKSETIYFLKRRISLNGMKTENWLAKKKWEEDLLYVQSL